MQDSRLLSLLRTLSAKEWSQLEAYLKSHDHSSNLRIFRELRKYAPRFTSRELSMSAFLKRWPQWSEQRLRQQLSKLTAALEVGLAGLRHQDDDWALQLELYAIGQERGLPYLARKAQRRIEKALAVYPLRDYTYYKRCYDWAALQQQYADAGQRGFQPLLQEASDQLDAFFAFEKTRQVWQMANLETMLEVDYDYGLGEPLQQWLITQKADDAVRAVYAKALRLTLPGLEESARWPLFEKTRQLLLEQLPYFPKLEAQQIYTSLLNYCTRQLNRTGQERYRRAYFDLNRELLDKGWLQEKGVLSPWRYINLVAVALALGEAAWAKAFAEDYKAQLPAVQRENAYHYSLGQYHYAVQQLPQAQQYLMQVAFEEPLFNAGVRLLLAKVLYDAGEEELLLHQLEANRLFFLRNKSIDETRKAQLEAFNLFLKRLARTPDFDKEALQGLQAELPGPTEIMGHAWLAERLNRRLSA